MKDNTNLFEGIKINEFSWQFKYKGKQYHHSWARGCKMSKELQVKIIQNMIGVIERILQWEELKEIRNDNPYHWSKSCSPTVKHLMDGIEEKYLKKGENKMEIIQLTDYQLRLVLANIEKKRQDYEEDNFKAGYIQAMLNYRIISGKQYEEIYK